MDLGPSLTRDALFDRLEFDEDAELDKTSVTTPLSFVSTDSGLTDPNAKTDSRQNPKVLGNRIVLGQDTL